MTAWPRQRFPTHVEQTCTENACSTQHYTFTWSEDRNEHRLLRCIDERVDSPRIYRPREDREQYLKTYGITREIDFDAPLIV